MISSLDRNKNFINFNNGGSNGGGSNDGSDRSKCNLIVNYLPQSLKEEQFCQLFEQIGPIRTYKLMHNKQTGMYGDSFGYGFVDYQNPDDAIKAIETYNGYQIENKRLKVAYAKQHEDDNNNSKSTNLYISNLPIQYDEQNLQDLFTPYGEVLQVRILRDPTTLQSRRIGFVIMATNQQAQSAIASLDNYVPTNSTEALNVKFANENGKKRQQTSAHQSPHHQRNSNFDFNDKYNNNNNHHFQKPTGGFYDNFQTQNNNNNNYQNQGKLKSFYRNDNNNVGGGFSDPYGTNTMDTSDSGNIIYVYGIGPHTSESELFTLFNNVGRIQRVNVIKNQSSGVGKGYGFVVFETYEEACNAVRQINGYMFNNRPLQVSLKK